MLLVMSLMSFRGRWMPSKMEPIIPGPSSTERGFPVRRTGSPTDTPADSRLREQTKCCCFFTILRFNYFLLAPGSIGLNQVPFTLTIFNTTLEPSTIENNKLNPNYHPKDSEFKSKVCRQTRYPTTTCSLTTCTEEITASHIKHLLKD